MKNVGRLPIKSAEEMKKLFEQQNKEDQKIYDILDSVMLEFDSTKSAASICKAIDEEIMEKLLHPMISIYTGKVVWFDSKKGFGFISRENQPDIFVHFSDIAMDGYKNLIKDQTVQFQIGENYFGKPKAIKVSLVSLASP